MSLKSWLSVLIPQKNRATQTEDAVPLIMKELEQAKDLEQANQSESITLFEQELEQAHLLAAQLSLYFDMLPAQEMRGKGKNSYVGKKLTHGIDCVLPHQEDKCRLFICLQDSGTLNFVIKDTFFDDIAVEEVTAASIMKYREAVKHLYPTFLSEIIEPHQIVENLVTIATQLLKNKKRDAQTLQERKSLLVERRCIVESLGKELS